MACKLFPTQHSSVLIFAPVFDQTSFYFHDCNAMIALVHFKGVFSEADLFPLVESQMMSVHFHGHVCAMISPEKFMECLTAAMELFIRRLDIDGVHAEASRRLSWHRP